MDESPRTIEGPVPCIRCGYDLRGTAVNGSCPECGASTVESLAASRSITKREVAELFCRLLAVWMGFISGLQLLQLAIQITVLVFDAANGPSYTWIIYAWGHLLGYLLIASLLWWVSPWIAKHLISQDGPAIPTATWTGRDLMAVAVCLLGLYLLATGTEQLIGNFFGETISSMAGYDSSSSVKIGSSVRALAGVLMLINRRHLAWWLHKARTAGTPQA